MKRAKLVKNIFFLKARGKKKKRNQFYESVTEAGVETGSNSLPFLVLQPKGHGRIVGELPVVTVQFLQVNAWVNIHSATP